MILVSFLVLIIAILLLIVGLVRETAGVIWAAIAASGISFVLLVIGNRMASAGRRPAVEGAPSEVAPEPAMAVSTGTTETAAWAPPAEAAVPPTAGVLTEARPSAPPPASEMEPVAAPVEAPPPAGNPIDGYDDLSVASIVPLLSSLSYEELVRVRDHEERNAGRKTLLARIEVMIRNLAPAAPLAPPPAPDAPVAEPPPPVPEPIPVPPAPAEPVLAEGAGLEPQPVAAGDLPVVNFDLLNATDAQKAMAGLDADALLTMWEYESEHAGRKSVLNRIETLYLKTGDMPIEGYDGASVTAVKPLLKELLGPELRAVKAHEEANQNRTGLISEIDRLLAKM